MINAVPEIGVRVYFVGMVDQRQVKQFSNIIYLFFLAEEVVVQICHCFNDYKFYLRKKVKRKFRKD